MQYVALPEVEANMNLRLFSVISMHGHVADSTLDDCSVNPEAEMWNLIRQTNNRQKYTA